MSEENKKIIIIGGGLTGLTLAYLLNKKGISPTILEARNRIGGRIQTIRGEGLAPIEMGATWLGAKHQALKALLDELHIGVFQQELSDRAFYEPISTSPHQLVQLPPNDDPSFRIQGGSSILIDALRSSLKEDQILNNQIVRSISKNSEALAVKTAKESFQADIVISTLPPYLLTKSIEFDPLLPLDLFAVAQETHTWMGESIKVGLTFKKPFWRHEDSSGTIFSNVGPISEMYDHSNYEDNLFALKGFINGAYSSATKEQRISVILDQLTKYFGSKVKDYLTYEELVWSKESFTYAPYEITPLPHQNNGHKVFNEGYMDGHFFIAGSETSPAYPGYMEGAVQSAILVSKKVSPIPIPE